MFNDPILCREQLGLACGIVGNTRTGPLLITVSQNLLGLTIPYPNPKRGRVKGWH